MKLRAITLAVALTAMASGSAMAIVDGGTIGVFFDAAGTTCAGNIPVYVPTDIYILAKPDAGLPSGGITGAEFRVKGKTAQMLITPTANPASNLALGNPFSDESLTENKGGCNIAFPDCQTPDANNVVLLYTVSMTLLALEPDIVFEVDMRDPPTNVNNNFAHVTACDAPTFSPKETIAGIAYMNHGSPGGCEPVAVEEKTWSSIKNLYH